MTERSDGGPPAAELRECGVQRSAFRVQSLSKICVLRATKSRLTKKGSARYRANVRITVLPDLINLALCTNRVTGLLRANVSTRQGARQSQQ